MRERARVATVALPAAWDATTTYGGPNGEEKGREKALTRTKKWGATESRNTVEASAP